MAEQLVEAPGFEFVFVRRAEGALCLGVVRAAGHTWFMCVWCLSSVHRQSGGYCCYVTETGTHSVKLYFFELVIDMPAVVHVKVVGNTVMAQRSSRLVLRSRPL